MVAVIELQSSSYSQCNVIDIDRWQGTAIFGIHGKGPLKGKFTFLHTYPSFGKAKPCGPWWLSHTRNAPEDFSVSNGLLHELDHIMTTWTIILYFHLCCRLWCVVHFTETGQLYTDSAVFVCIFEGPGVSIMLPHLVLYTLVYRVRATYNLQYTTKLLDASQHKKAPMPHARQIYFSLI